MNVHHIIAFVTLIAAVIVAWRRPKYRRQLLWGAIFSIPVLLLNIVFAGTFARLGFDFSDALLSIVSAFIGITASGALLAALYEAIINRRLTPVSRAGRQHLWWLTVGILLGIILAALGVPLLLAVAIGLLIDIIFVLLLAREVFWDVFIGAFGFAIWYALADVAFGLRTSGDIARLVIGQQPFGLTLAGLSIERVLVMASIGALVSPLFVALRKRRFPDQTEEHKTNPWKMVVGTVMTVLFAVMAFWFTMNYVRAPSVKAMTPTLDATAVATDSSLTFRFTLPVDRNAVQLQLQPDVSGYWRFEQPTTIGHAFKVAVFVFDTALPPNTTLTGRVTGIQSLWGLSGRDQTVRFTTGADASVSAVTTTPEPPIVTNTDPLPINTNTVAVTNTVIVPPAPTPVPVTNTAITPSVPAPTPAVPAASSPPVQRKLLPVAVHYQEQPLSCEAAALKMALAAAGVKVSETQIMKIVGYDPTPHRGNVWGDPNVAFVGNIAGKQDTTGYGVYWDPIAKAARHWATATVITNGTIARLTAAIDAGQAVVVWGTFGSNVYRDDWKTPAGKAIKAWKGEHARTLIGYVGSASNPTSVIINDPIAGRITWSKSTFLANWARFDNSGVIVE